MLIGVVLFTFVSSSILDITLSDSLNIYKNRDNEEIIEKMQLKYGLVGNAKRYLALLGDSVYTENLKDEIEFTSRLPHFMKDCVLDSI
jgi:hypothetical protein